MRVLVVGGGAREHALAWRIAQSRSATAVGLAPGNDLAALDYDVMPCDMADTASVLAAARDYRADFVVVGPEAPLAAGAANVLASAGIVALGPTRNAAALEASKAYAKELMTKAGVPTAPYGTFTDADSAKEYVRTTPSARVVKADGLMAGKGVVVCESLIATEKAIDALFGRGVKQIVIEGLLPGPELSLIALCDGTRATLFSLSRDYKRIGTGDVGANTGGMGAFCPLPRRDGEALAELTIAPILREFSQRGTPYRGFLYAGLMFDGAAAYVLEYNVRLGDPEAQVLLTAAQDDLLPALYAAACGLVVDFPRPCGAAVCIVLASRGYPESPELGAAIVGVAAAKRHPHVHIFASGVRLDGGTLRVAGGRVLSVVGHASTVAEARRRAYAAADEIHFDSLIRREDIAAGVALERT